MKLASQPPVSVLTPHGNSWGTLTSEGAYKVLLELSRAHQTGLFEIYAKDRIYALALRRGTPIYARPGVLPWVLGDVIGHLGLHPQDGERVLEGVDACQRERVGEVLVKCGVLSRFDIDRALKEQIRLRAQEFLPLTDGRYRFWAGGDHLKDLPRQPDRWTAGELVDVVKRSGGRAEALRCLLRRLESSPDPFTALGVTCSHDREAARAAFRRLAKDHHPDRLGQSQGPMERFLHRRIFQAALKAYEKALAANDERHIA